jgi:hypothetical protein
MAGYVSKTDGQRSLLSLQIKLSKLLNAKEICNFNNKINRKAK